MTARGRVQTASTDTRVNAVLDLLMTGAQVNIEQRLSEVAESTKEKFLSELEAIEERIARTKNITVTNDRETVEVEGLTHKSFNDLLAIVNTGFPLLLVGTAGSGKTHAAEQVSKALSLPFYAISVGAQTSKSDILGYMSATGTYIKTGFRDAYEHGGVFLMDEIDAGNPNVLIVLNSALSGNACAFPDQMVKRHKDFLFIATANTFGTGASRQYVGRNQLDAATLDRFVIFEWSVDPALEAALVKDFEHGPQWYKVVKAVREKAEKQGYRVIVSPRATLKGVHLLKSLDLTSVVESVLLIGATEDQRKALTEAATAAWAKG